MLGKGVRVFIGPQHPAIYNNYDVISKGPPLVLRHKTYKTFSARILELGLATADFSTEEEARQRLHNMLLFDIRSMRSTAGQDGVEKWLTGLGVPWEKASGEQDEVVFAEA